MLVGRCVKSTPFVSKVFMLLIQLSDHFRFANSVHRPGQDAPPYVCIFLLKNIIFELF